MSVFNLHHYRCVVLVAALLLIILRGEINFHYPRDRNGANRHR
jgi:hypothetical protein